MIYNKTFIKINLKFIKYLKKLEILLNLNLIFLTFLHLIYKYSIYQMLF